ncbi:MAG: hypothetical protein WD768_02700 [Phycisphaeraceae bacterium]
MQVNITPEMERFVREKLSAGEYASPDALVADALALMRDLPVWTDDALRRELEIGAKELDDGRGEPWDKEATKAALRERMGGDAARG